MPFLRKDQIAGMNIHYLYYSLDYFLDSQVKAGFQTIELWGGAPHFWLDHLSFSDCRSIRKKIEARGLKVVVFTPESCIYQYQISAEPRSLFEKSFQYFSNGIRVAAELGCRIMAINSGWGYRNEDPLIAWERSVEMLGNLANVGTREGITLAMETLRPEESQIVTTLYTAKKMFDEIDQPSFKLMIDTCAMSVAGETIRSVV